MTSKQRRLERMRAIEREWRVAAIAADRLGEYLRAHPSALDREQLRIADYRRFRDNLEPTYLIRTFGEFEGGLREAWSLAFRQITTPRMQDLIDSFAARCTIAREWRDGAHEVRLYRNPLVHERGDEVRPIRLLVESGWLCRFFSRLSHEW